MVSYLEYAIEVTCHFLQPSSGPSAIGRIFQLIYRSFIQMLRQLLWIITKVLPWIDPISARISVHICVPCLARSLLEHEPPYLSYLVL